VNEYHIRNARPEDAVKLAALVNSAYRGDYAKQGWTNEADLIDGTRTDADALRDILSRKDTTILIYEQDSSIIGCVELVVEKPKLYLQMLTVEPKLQGKGVGKILLNAGEQFARDNGCSEIKMSVVTVRSELIEWYERNGYMDSGERKPFAFSDPRFGHPKQPLEFMIMEKSLANF
jgi:ribosomal protein S18 acetylase RimI-like enzyme